MIPIALSTALALYSAIIVAGALIIWIYTAVKVQYAQRAMGKQFMWHCTFCAFTYLDEEAEALSKCPRCGSYNAQDDRHARYVPVPKAARRETGAEEVSPSPRRNPSRRKRPRAMRRGPRRRR